MAKRILTLDPARGFTPLLGRYVTMLEDVRSRTLRYVDGLTAEQLSWHPNPKVESIGTTLLHIAGVEFSYIQEDILKREMGEEWLPAFPIRYNLEQVSGEPLEYFTAKLAEVREQTTQALRELSDEDLSRIIVPPDPETGEVEYSIEWILYHLAEHEAHHKGQIAVMKRLLPT